MEAAIAGLVLRRRGDPRAWSRASLASLAANATSAAVGLLLRSPGK